MADPRTWTHQQLLGRAALLALLPEGANGVRQHRSFESAPAKRPFVTVRLGEARPRVKDGGVTVSSHTEGQVWAHDDPGSYLAIDAVLREVQGAIEAGAGDQDVTCGEWLDESGDLRDPELGTIVRFGRFRVVHRTVGG